MISNDTKPETRVTHPIGGDGTIKSHDVVYNDRFFVLFDKTKNRKPWLVKRNELTEIATEKRCSECEAGCGL